MTTSRRCSATTASGLKCRGWAVRDTHPPLCASHAGRTVGAGAPLGNKNARKHGYYDDTLTERERANLATHAANRTADDEIGMVRTFLHRLMEVALDPELPRQELYAIGKLLIPDARAVSYMLKQSDSTADDIWDQILEELNDELDQHF